MSAAGTPRDIRLEQLVEPSWQPPGRSERVEYAVDVEEGECTACERSEAEAGPPKPTGSAGTVQLCWDCYHTAGEEGLETIARLTRERDEALTAARTAQAGEAYRKAETDQAWQVLRDRGVIDIGGGDIDRHVAGLIDALERAETERDEAQTQRSSECLAMLVYLLSVDVQRLPEDLAALVVAWRSKPAEKPRQTCLQCDAEASTCTCVDGPRIINTESKE